MNNFKSDDQRKAVMASLNSHKPNSSSVEIDIRVPGSQQTNRMINPIHGKCAKCGIPMEFDSKDPEKFESDTGLPFDKNDFYCNRCGGKPKHERAVKNLLSRLDLAESEGGKFRTGKYVKFTFMKNNDKAEYFGSRYGQDIEPFGRYVLEKDHDMELHGNWIEGKIELKNPLVIQHKDTVQWKKDLFSATGKKRKSLSRYLKELGFDGIVTVGKNHASEIVIL